MQNLSANSSYEDYINNINNQMTYYFVMTSSAIGIPGNLISMLVFIRLMQKNPKINMGLLYTCQTAIDLTVLTFTLFVFRGSVYLLGYAVINISDPYCRTFAFLRRYILHASSWMSVLIIFDRFTFVLYKHRFKFMKNKLILSAIISVVMILVAIVNIPNLLYYIAGLSKTSLFTCVGSNEVTMASDIISILVRTYIPIILMVVFNSLMIRRLYKSSKSSQIIQNSSLMRKEHQFTIAAMSCDVLFFLTHFPLSIFYIFYDSLLYSASFKTDSLLSSLYTLYWNTFLNISYIDKTCSIFTYLVFNNLFRKEFIRIVFKLVPCCKAYGRSFDAENNSFTINMMARKSNIQSMF